jgi:hypothetical protein
MWGWILLLVIISIYNTIYSFLSEKIQKKWWIKALGISAASILLIYGIFQIISDYNSSSDAYVSNEGNIIESRNFTWEIGKSKTSDGNWPVFIIKNRYGDSSEVKIQPDSKVNYQVYNAIDGVAVKFFCKEKEVPSFKIKIGP